MKPPKDALTVKHDGLKYDIYLFLDYYIMHGKDAKI
jgi:hypothetical protein